MIESQPTVVSLTDAAAMKLQELTKEETNPDIGLRVYVYSGGCSGYRYGMMLEEAPTPDDQILTANGVRVYVDQNSIQYPQRFRDRLRRYAHGRGLHREQPECRRCMWLWELVPDRRRGGFAEELLPTDEGIGQRAGSRATRSRRIAGGFVMSEDRYSRAMFRQCSERTVDTTMQLSGARTLRSGDLAWIAYLGVGAVASVVFLLLEAGSFPQHLWYDGIGRVGRGRHRRRDPSFPPFGGVESGGSWPRARPASSSGTSSGSGTPGWARNRSHRSLTLPTWPAIRSSRRPHRRHPSPDRRRATVPACSTRRSSRPGSRLSRGSSSSGRWRPRRPRAGRLRRVACLSGRRSLLIGVLMGLATAPGARVTSFWLIGASLGMLLVADQVYALQNLAGSYARAASSTSCGSSRICCGAPRPSTHPWSA